MIDVDALPRLFTNLDQISAVHVGVLAAIDARVQVMSSLFVNVIVCCVCVCMLIDVLF